MNLEERLEYLDANSNDPAIWAEWEGWVFAKLREAVGELAKPHELGSDQGPTGIWLCRFCGRSSPYQVNTPESITHTPDCKAQKWLEG